MADPLRWVNAVIEVVIPLDVPVDASATTKQDAVADAMERVSLPRNAVMRATWEDVEAPPLGPEPTIPDPPAQIKHTFTRGERFGWYCSTTHGIAIVGEVPMWAWTQKGIHKKADRLSRRLRKQDARTASAEVRVG